MISLFLAVVFTTAQGDSKYKYTKSLLEGKWYVVATNYSMWLNSKNTNPYFNYTNFREQNRKLKFDDCVTYTKSNTEKKIKGRETQKNDNELKFVWRGKGLLGMFKSKWRVIATDKEGRWIAIYFSKTVVSPEGVDIIARKKNLSDNEIKGIIEHIDKAYIKKPIVILK